LSEIALSAEGVDHLELFGELHLYWTYLSPHLFKHLVYKLKPLEEIQGEMEAYMTSLSEFRMGTPLKLFCAINKEHIKPPERFQTVVATFKDVKSKKMKSKKMTLQDLENFWLEYGKIYKLCELALILRCEVMENSFIVTFFVPDSVVELLQNNVPKELLRNFGVTKLVLVGNCIFMDDNEYSQ